MRQLTCNDNNYYLSLENEFTLPRRILTRQVTGKIMYSVASLDLVLCIDGACVPPGKIHVWSGE